MDVKHPTTAVLRLAALAAALILAFSHAQLSAQPTLRAPDSHDLDLSPALEVEEGAVQHFHQPAETAPCHTCGSSYWIVSSRHCNTHDRRAFVNCPLQFLQVGPDRQPRPGDQQQLVDSLEPGAPVVIVVHGSFTDWQDVYQGSVEIYNWLRPADATGRAQYVFYTWPANTLTGAILPLDFGILGCRSSAHGVHLARLISMIPADRPVSIIGHSLGTRAISSALHLRSGGAVQGIQLGLAPDYGRRIRVVFVAAAIDNHWLNPGERFGLALWEPEYLINLTSRRDFALALYPYRRLFSRHALAKTGFTPSNRRKLGDLTYKLAELDVTPIVGFDHLWRTYVQHPQIAQSIGPTLFYLDDAARQPVPVPAATSEPVTIPESREEASAPVHVRFPHLRRTRPAGRR